MLALVVVNLVPPVRGLVGSGLGQVTRGVTAVVTPRDARVERLTKEALAAQQKARSVTRVGDVVAEYRSLTSTYGSRGKKIVVARVISFTPVSATGSDREVQLDAGWRAGLHSDQAVVTPAGLVGRIVAVSDDSATVRLLADPASVVGARIERTSGLARVVGKPPQGAVALPAGEVSLVVAGGAGVRRGDAVVTSGSPGDVPYPAGLRLGTVARLDPDRGQLERSAVLTPAVDASSLDLVGVLVDEAG